ncbi:4Fe-4S dicluster domain-containing protein [Aestuariibacter salexigens]|uniref:4Fe-4S dicluster domain-containing protein n=1 Tax=Aestuariibacter salexigens TaxID=226010 RepID=UPI000411B09B|nr:4Fe-4S dicluster domain-containing protein [Aestuariibacter salexigens]
MEKGFLPRENLSQLHAVLCQQGYKVIGPQVKDGAIVFDGLRDIADLPWGIVEHTEAGAYRLEDTGDNRCFAWNNGPQGLKPWLFKSQQTVWRGEATSDGIRFKSEQPSPQPLAFIGIRSCDISALYLQDKHFMHSAYADPWYTAQRKQLCLIAVNCSRSNDTCFCESTGDGVEATYGYDILLDELDDGYLVDVKSERGRAITAALPLQPGSQQHHKQAQRQLKNARHQQRVMPDAEQLLKLLEHLNDKHWQDIAERCLACGNCTLTCPTCFCSKQEAEVEPVSGEHHQVRYWDSCFSEKHGYIAGMQLRGDVSQRYRQWMTHKLATWQAQYDRSGCVGCGRCISWCPAAIDIVAEANLILGDDHD